MYQAERKIRNARLFFSCVYAVIYTDKAFRGNGEQRFSHQLKVCTWSQKEKKEYIYIHFTVISVSLSVIAISAKPVFLGTVTSTKLA